MELLLPLHLDVIAIEKGAFGLPSNKVPKFTYFIAEKITKKELNIYTKITVYKCKENYSISF